MSNNSSGGKSFGLTTFESSLHAIGTVMAAIAALLLTGHVWQFTADPVHGYLLYSYGNQDLADIGILIWGALTTVGIFYICRAVFILTLMILAEHALYRFVF